MEPNNRVSCHHQVSSPIQRLAPQADYGAA